jgi:hypothetical protein
MLDGLLELHSCRPVGQTLLNSGETCGFGVAWPKLFVMSGCFFSLWRSFAVPIELPVRHFPRPTAAYKTSSLKLFFHCVLPISGSASYSNIDVVTS